MKILLLGISSSGEFNGSSLIFKNNSDPDSQYLDISNCSNIIGKIPADFDNLYKHDFQYQNQDTFDRSLTKNLLDINHLINSSEYKFEKDEVEVHCIKIETGQVSTVICNDNEVLKTDNSSKELENKPSIIITSLQSGNEYNYFNINIKSDLLELSYTQPVETKSINIIDDPSISTKFTARLRTKSTHEIVNIINTSPFSKYINAKTFEYKNSLDITSNSNAFEFPDSKESFRINKIYSVHSNSTEKVDFSISNYSYRLNNKKIRSITCTVIETLTINATDFFFEPMNVQDIEVIEGSEFIESINYPHVQFKPNCVGEIVKIKYPLNIVKFDGITSETMTNVYNDENDTLTFYEIGLNRIYSVTFDYYIQFTDYNIINYGYISKGRIISFMNFEDTIEKFILTSHGPLSWLYSFDPILLQNIKDDYEAKNDIKKYMEPCIAALNNALCSDDMYSFGLTLNTTIKNKVSKLGYNLNTCREINTMSLELNYPGMFTIDYEESAILPMICFPKDINTNNITVVYERNINRPMGEYKPVNGHDNYTFSTTEYYNNILDSITKFNLGSYISANRIDYVVVAGGFINSYDPLIRTETKRLAFNINQLIPANDVYYITHHNLPPDAISVVITEISDTDYDGKIRIESNKIIFDIVPTGNIINDLVTTTPNFVVYVEYQTEFKFYTRYDELFDIIFPDMSERPYELKTSIRPFTSLYDSPIKETNYKKYLNNIIDTFYNTKSYINTTISSGIIESNIEYHGKNITTLIDPSIFSLFGEYIAGKSLQTKMNTNWSDAFTSKVKSNFIMDIDTETMKLLSDGRIEYISCSGIEGHVVFLNDRTKHPDNIMGRSCYKYYVKELLILLYDIIESYKGLIIVAESTMQATFTSKILTQFGPIIRDLVVTVVYDNIGAYLVTVNFKFVNTNDSISIPLLYQI